VTRFRLIPRSGPLDRPTAWGCVTSNLAFPGSGSLLAGRASGYLQVLLALAGAALTTVFGLRFIAWFLANRVRLQDVEMDPVERLLELWIGVRWALLGMGVFALAWLWALATSAWILREAARPRPPKPPRLDA
jgi:hypothetical protein